MKAISCDLDGVVTNFTHSFSRLCHSLCDDAPIVTYADVPNWDWHEWYMKGDTRAASIIEGSWDIIMGRNDKVPNPFWAMMEPLYNMDYLREVYHKWPVVFMTRRDGPEAYKQSMFWLRDQGLKEPLLMRIKSGQEKHEVCAKFGITTIIDDNPKIVKACIEAGMDVVMMAYRYNDHLPSGGVWKGHGRLTKAYNLEEALRKARDFEKR